MSVKKILLIVVVICLLAGVITGIYMYRKLHRPSQLPAHIPASAETVIYINFKSVYKHLIQYKDSAIKLRKFKNPYLGSIKDPMATGLDFLSDAACVKYRHTWYFIAMLDDKEELRHTLEQTPAGLFEPVKQHEGFNSIWSGKDSFILAWNKHLLVALPKSGPQADETFIKDILEIREENSFSREKTLEQSAKKDALAWFYTSGIDLKISAPGPLKGYMAWDSSIHVIATDHISEPYHVTTTSVVPADENYIYTDTGNNFINKSLEALLLVYLPDEVEGIKKSNIDKYPKMFSLGGQKTIENTSITYVYDDNFTKQKIVTTTIDTIHSAYLQIFRPGSVNVIVSNDKENLRSMHDMPPSNVRLMAHFNEELLSPLYPFPATYHMDFIHTYNKGFNYYELSLQPGSLLQFIELR
jgi:uncharacterized protein YneF (UPF0154 family)